MLLSIQSLPYKKDSALTVSLTPLLRLFSLNIHEINTYQPVSVKFD